MSNLYELTTEVLSLMDDENVTDEALTSAFGDITNKAENVAKYLAVLDSHSDIFKKEIERLSARRKAVDNHITRVKEYLIANMNRLEIDRLEAGTFTISLQANPPGTECSDETATPAKYITQVTTQTIDKRAILADLKAGAEVAGWHIRRGKSLRIR